MRGVDGGHAAAPNFGFDLIATNHVCVHLSGIRLFISWGEDTTIVVRMNGKASEMKEAGNKR